MLHISLQADGEVVFEDIPVFGVCRPACPDLSLYLFVLVFFFEKVRTGSHRNGQPPRIEGGQDVARSSSQLADAPTRDLVWDQKYGVM